MQRYLEADVSAFAVRSTLRQLRELWMLDASRAPGDTILPMLDARLAELSGSLDADDATVALHPEDRTTYERVLGDTGFQSLKWLQDALDRAAGVVLLGPRPLAGEGTGFVIDGGWLGEAFADRPLLITNAHVCTNDKTIRRQFPNSFRSSELTASFLGLESGPLFVELADEVIWSSPPAELDATIVELAGDVPAEATAPSLRGASLQPGERAYVIGYPGGTAATQVSLQDNEVHHDEHPYLRYRTPTAGGSSGSPVFDDRWRLVAIHHAYKHEHELNEGVSIEAIFDAACAELGLPRPDR